jgi:tetratricopeptide (TPR) repeat protein
LSCSLRKGTPHGSCLLLVAIETAKAFGRGNPRLSTSLRTLGIVYEAMGQYAEAERLFRQALDVFEQAPARDSLEGAAAIANLAGISFVLGDYDEAERMAVMAQAVYEQLNGEREVNYAKALDVLADTTMLQGQGLYSLAMLYHPSGEPECQERP